MHHAHRMPIVRRLFSTSRSSKPSDRRSKTPSSAFANRFGSSSEPPSQHPSSFPIWPDARPAHQSSQTYKYVTNQLPHNLLAPVDRTKDDRLGKESHYQVATKRRDKELYSQVLGNLGELVKTSSYEAKLAIQPAMENSELQSLAARNNIDRFASLPSPADYKFGEKEGFASTDVALRNPNSPSATESESSSPNTTTKTISRAAIRSASSSPNSRMLSTVSTGVSSRFLPTVQPLACTEIYLSPIVSCSDDFSWSKCLSWASMPGSNCYSQSASLPDRIRRRLGSVPYHFMYSNHTLSLLRSSVYPSTIMAHAYSIQHTSKLTIVERCNSTKPARSQSKDPVSPPRHRSSTDSKSPYMLIPPPNTPIELCSALHHLIQSTTPRILVPRLMATHSQYPTLHTIGSFNILLAYATRIAPLYFRPIVAQLRASGIAWDATTQKLAVRAHMQAGRLKEAIELAERNWLPEGGSVPSAIPLDVFTELMHLALTPKDSRDDVAGTARRCWKLFPAHATADTSPRLAYNVVRLLLNQGCWGQAILLAKRLLQSLTHATPANIRFCRAIIGLVVRPPERSTRRDGPIPAPPFRGRLKLFKSLLACNPSLGLTPDATLIKHLFENLYRSREGGAIALHYLKELRGQYGTGVDGSSVRRLIARYAKHKGHFGLARDMRSQERRARDESPKVSAVSIEGDCVPRAVPWTGEAPLPMQSHLEYIEKIGTANVKWTTLSRNLNRAQAKRKLVHPGSERILSGKEKVVRWDTLWKKRDKLLTRVKDRTA